MALRWAIYFIVTSNEVTLLEVQSGMPLSSFFSYFCLALLPCKWCCVGQCYFIVTSNEVTLLKVRSGIPLSSYFHISAWRCYHVNGVALGNVILSPLWMKLLIYKQSASFLCCSFFYLYFIPPDNGTIQDGASLEVTNFVHARPKCPVFIFLYL